MKALLIVIILALVGALGYIVYDKVLYAPSAPPTVIVVTPTSTEPVACTMDARMCPDGSYVGRSGPACKFAACPGEGTTPPVEGMDAWRTFTSNDMTFQYPVDFGTIYTHPTYWPPVIEKSTMSVYTCVEGGFETQANGKTEKRMIGGREYCRTVSNALYEKEVKDYGYVTKSGDGVVVFQLSVRTPACTQYTGVQQEECVSEAEFFDLDSVVDQIYQTVEFRSY
jgi:hypothetical protein